MNTKSPLYCAVLLATILMAGTGLEANPNPGEQDILLADFDEKNVAAGWKTVNDNVMGGRSKGGPSFADGILTFAGATNTNGGGFSSIRTTAGNYDLSGKAGLLIRARGDGRTFKVDLRTNVTIGRWGVPFRADFKTIKGEWREFFVPFDEFVPSMFGQPLKNPPALDTSKVSAFGFMIYDKKDGAFSLEVDWVKAVSANQTSFVKSQSGTIIDRAIKDGRFGTLAAALTEAELIEVLQGEGPFTVFAPTDEAFAKLPKGTVEELLKPENREKLQAVLKYHVSSGATQLVTALDLGTAKTVQGETLSIAFSDGRVRVNGAAILNADIKCSNGVIHVIDTVLLPPKPRNDILNVAKRAGGFTTLLAAVKAAGMEDALGSKGPFTILAPTDEAFKNLPKGTLQELLRNKNRKQLKAILAYHVIPGKVSAGDALNAQNAKTLNGTSAGFAIKDGLLKVNNTVIRKTDIVCDNGVIHVIDAVLLPPSKEQTHQKDKTAKAASMGSVERIKSAIERGVPAFNDGDPGKCAAIYKECLEALTKDEAIDAALRTAIERLLEYGGTHASDVDRAWIYRGGLDQVLLNLIGT